MKTSAPIIDGKRRCSRCRETKPIEQFHVDKTNRSGFRGTCRVCMREVSNRSRDRGPLTREERFLEKVEPEPNTGCWLWTSIVGNNGYGLFHNGEKIVIAHRWSYENFRGPIPGGLEIDHICRVRCCVNPQHLRALTRYENIMRATTNPIVAHANKTHCLRGHELSGDNLYYRPSNGQRVCKACRKIHAKAAKTRSREQRSA